MACVFRLNAIAVERRPNRAVLLTSERNGHFPKIGQRGGEGRFQKKKKKEGKETKPPKTPKPLPPINPATFYHTVANCPIGMRGPARSLFAP